MSTFHFAVIASAVMCMQTVTALAHDRTHAPHERTYQTMFPEPTLPRATDVPDRILVTWKQDPATSFAVTWRSLAAASAVAEIAVAQRGPEFNTDIERIEADTSGLKTHLGDVSMHAATFEDLEPETLYVYRVGSRRTEALSAESAEGLEPHAVDYAWSEWFHVRTAARFTDTVEPLRFVYVGDAQNDVKSHYSRLIREAFREAPKMTFLLSAGDLINRGNNDHEWGQWFHAGDFIFATVPHIAVPGNHEYAVDEFHAEDAGAEPVKRLSRRWAQRFEYPENGPEGSTENIYYTDIQGVRVIALDSNIDPEPQAEWLESVLKDNPNRWTVVTQHHPIHSTSRGRDNEALRSAWQPLYDKYGVDLVLQGHDHSYGRTAPLLGDINEPVGMKVASDNGGPVYVVSVSGPKQYVLKDYEEEQRRNPFVIRTDDTQLYQIIDVTHNALEYVARTATGELYDRFRISKTADGQKAFIDESPKSGTAGH